MLRRRAALIFIALLALGDAVAAADLWLLWQQRHGDASAVAAAVLTAPADAADTDDPAVSPPPPARALPPR